MATAPKNQLIAHSRVSAWGFLVALTMAAAFLASGVRGLHLDLLPSKLGIFVEPPSWLIGTLLIAFALFLFLVGISELARYVKPAPEIIIDRDGIASFGVLGERRFAWRDVISVELNSAALSLKLRGRGRIPPPDLRNHFDRLDVDRRGILACIRMHRPELLSGLASEIDA